MGWSGQPMAFAIGSHTASTTGESTRGGAFSTSFLPPPSVPLASAQRSLITSTSNDDAGDHTATSVRPASSDSIDSAEPSASASTRMGRPPEVRGLVRWKASMESVRKAFFSEP